MCAKHVYLVDLHVKSCVYGHVFCSGLADLLNYQSKGYFSGQFENSVVFRHPLSFSEFMVAAGSSLIISRDASCASFVIHLKNSTCTG